MDPFIALYSTNAEQDNESMLNFYRQVITEAMQTLLVPDALKALRKDMMAKGEKKVLTYIEDKFWCEATMPPLRLQYVAESPDDAPEVRSAPSHCLLRAPSHRHAWRAKACSADPWSPWFSSYGDSLLVVLQLMCSRHGCATGRARSQYSAQSAILHGRFLA